MACNISDESISDSSSDTASILSGESIGDTSSDEDTSSSLLISQEINKNPSDRVSMEFNENNLLRPQSIGDEQESMDLSDDNDNNSVVSPIGKSTKVDTAGALQQLLSVSSKGSAVPLNASDVNGSVDTGKAISSHRNGGDSTVSTLPIKSSVRPVNNVIQNWRRCLWPPLSPFYRMLLRCKCVYTPRNSDSPGNFGNKRNNTAVTTQEELRDSSKNDPVSAASALWLEWSDFWNPVYLKPVALEYSCPAEHNRTFFLLLMEECRAWMSSVLFGLGNMQGKVGAVGHVSSIYSAQYNRRGYGDQAVQSWQKSVVTGLSRFTEALDTADDPKLGNLWVIDVNMIQQDGDKSGVGVSRYVPGDLLAITCDLWTDRIALGIVKGWDPDCDLMQTAAVGQDNLSSYKLVVCMESVLQGSTSTDSRKRGRNEYDADQLGGWFQQGDICEGTPLNLRPIGNTTTSARECQALSSLAAIRPKLRDVLLSPSRYADTVSAMLCADSTCPEGISFTMWSELQAQYNSSQLKAISSICWPQANIEKAEGKPSVMDSRADENTKPLPIEAVPSPYPLLLLQGPPGTGKTHTILGMISVLLEVGVPGDGPKKSGQKVTVGASLTSRQRTKVSSAGRITPSNKVRILFCAPSNTAVDELAGRLKRVGVLGPDGKRRPNLNIVRIGQSVDAKSTSPETDSEYTDTLDLTLDYLVEKKRRDLETAHKHSGESRGQNMLPRIPGTVRLRQIILEEADVVCSTLSGAGSVQLLECIMGGSTASSRDSSSANSKGKLPFSFDVVIIDEASQSVEPSTLIPLKYNPKMVIMVGDPNQLRATVQSSSCVNFSYGQSLFERLNLAGYPKLMLETQYRMHPEISLFPSRRFYGGRLVDDARMKTKPDGLPGSHWKPYHDHPSGKFRPLVLHNIWRGRQELVGTSYCNKVEGDFILNLFAEIRSKYARNCSGGVGIIAAYKAQQQYLRRIFRSKYGPQMGGVSGRSDYFRGKVEISTVDGFQGREMDIIIFSCVRTVKGDTRGALDSNKGVGFMSEWQRLNVALTRAKYALWIVGDVKQLKRGGDVWKDLIDHCRVNRCVMNS